MLAFAVFFVVGVLAQQTFADEPEAIVGGTPAAPAEFRHQVSLQINGQHFCGGSIIAPTKILTAAHCVHGSLYPPYSNVRVLTGTNHVSQGGQYHTVKSIRTHPYYNPQVITNDVAVITLNAPIQYNSYQSAIALASSPPVPGTYCTLSGWGLTRARGSLSSILLKMNQAIVGQAQCQQALRGVNTINESNVCALNQRGIGACQGDSGGPFICGGVQYGITSWGIPCAEGFPDAYTNVYYHRNFILSS